MVFAFCNSIKYAFKVYILNKYSSSASALHSICRFPFMEKSHRNRFNAWQWMKIYETEWFHLNPRIFHLFTQDVPGVTAVLALWREFPNKKLDVLIELVDFAHSCDSTQLASIFESRNILQYDLICLWHASISIVKAKCFEFLIYELDGRECKEKVLRKWDLSAFKSWKNQKI